MGVPLLIELMPYLSSGLIETSIAWFIEYVASTPDSM